MFPASTTYFFSGQSYEPQQHHHHNDRDRRIAEMGRRAFVNACSHDNNAGRTVVAVQQPVLVERTVYTERPMLPMMMSQPTYVTQPVVVMSQPMQSHHSSHSGPRHNHC